MTGGGTRSWGRGLRFFPRSLGGGVYVFFHPEFRGGGLRFFPGRKSQNGTPPKPRYISIERSLRSILVPIFNNILIVFFSWGTFKGTSYLDMECLNGLFLQIPEAVKYWKDCEGTTDVISALAELNSEALGMI